MRHLGDITLIKGNEAPTVDCIIGGSPCQDLSLAGKRAGLAGARSGLYMEQIRIIKEMRKQDVLRGRTDVDVRPRYMVWENVPGAFSTNKGQDFAAVLEEAIRVAEPEAPNVDVPEKGWPTSGCFYDEMGKWSVAWRVLDAQFWGTSDKPLPQRRRRIALVADFGGLSASEILFVRESVSGNTEPGKPKRKEASGDVGDCAGGAVGCDVFNLTTSGDKAVSLTTAYNATGTGPTVAVPVLDDQGGQYINVRTDGMAPTLRAETHENLPCVMNPVITDDQGTHRPKAVGFPLGFRPENVRCYDELATTLCNGTRPGFTTGVIQEMPVIAVDQGGGKFYCSTYEGVAPTLTRTNDGAPAVTYCIEMTSTKNAIGEDGICPTLTARMGTGGNQVQAVLDIVPTTYQKVTGPLMANSHPGSYTGQDAFSDMLVAGPVGSFQQTGIGWWNESGIGATIRAMSGGDAANANLIVNAKHIVRRLTPLECERLQGYPDGWTLIGEPVEEEVPDYISEFDESKYVEPKPEDFGLTEEDINDYSQIDDDDSEDDAYFRYLQAKYDARQKATKKTKIGSHKEINYYYTDSSGKRRKVSDSARYKALGNSIALPPWKWVLKRLCACYERDATMASLFDGIGGFPLIWEQLNGKGSCLWASEIEEFPMAVTKERFGE